RSRGDGWRGGLMDDARGSEDELAQEAPPRNRLRPALRRVSQQSGFWIFLVLVGLVTFFSLSTPSGTFFSVFNLQTLLSDASEIMILATGALIVTVAGGIDLSAGSLMTLGAVVGYITMKATGGHLDSTGQIVWNNGWFAIVIGIAAGIG